MGKLQPYRLSARVTPGRDVVPRLVTVGLSVATCAFGIAALAWLIARAVALFDPSYRVASYVPPLYAWTVDAAMLLAAAPCAWRPIPGTRSHVFARLAIVGWLVAVVAERWSGHTVTSHDPCGVVLERLAVPPGALMASSIGRLLLFVSLAGTVLVAGRRFALPRWTPVVAAGLGATLTEVGLDELLRAHRAGSSMVLSLPMYTRALAELLMLVAFAAAFAMAARAVRRRPFLDEEVKLSTTHARTPSSELDARAFDYWLLSISAVLACLFAVASRVSEDLGFVPSLAGWGSTRSISCALGLVLFFVLVERARRRHAEASSLALTIASGFAALCGVASVLAAWGARPLVFRELALVTTAVTLGGMALHLPNLPVVAQAVTKVKGSLLLGALFLILSSGAQLYRTGTPRSVPATTQPWFTGETPLLLAAFFFVALAAHHARRVEEEALIAEALAARDSRAMDG